MTDSPTYKSWQWMLYRVRHDPEYIRRGIEVCPRWLDFQNFYADMGEKPEGELVSVERTDNNGDYCPENCHWSTPLEQNNNKRGCVFIESTQFGTRTRTEWAAILLTHTGDMSWDVRKLKKALDIFITIDALLEWRKITDLTAHCARLDVAELVPGEFVPA